MSGQKMRYLCRQDHTDTVPGLQKLLAKGYLSDLACRLALVAGVSRRNEHVCTMLEHILRWDFCENLYCCVEVAEHCIAPSPPNQADCVWVHPCHEEIHSPACL